LLLDVVKEAGDGAEHADARIAGDRMRGVARSRAHANHAERDAGPMCGEEAERGANVLDLLARVLVLPGLATGLTEVAMIDRERGKAARGAFRRDLRDQPRSDAAAARAFGDDERTDLGAARTERSQLGAADDVAVELGDD
jgi:hypothetical protein